MVGTKIIKAGIIGTTLSNAYEGSVGGVTNGNENNVGRFSTPKLLPSITYIVAKPNITLAKNAPKSRTLVICQITKLGTLSLWSLNLVTLAEIGSFEPLLRKVSAVLSRYQKIDDLFTILTRTKAIAERIIADIME
jgi:hypothetical protein